MRIARLTHHPLFYAIAGGICLQNPSSSYHAFWHPLEGTLLVIQIADGFGLLALAVLEIRIRAGRA